MDLDNYYAIEGSDFKKMVSAKEIQDRAGYEVETSSGVSFISYRTMSEWLNHPINRMVVFEKEREKLLEISRIINTLNSHCYSDLLKSKDDLHNAVKSRLKDINAAYGDLHFSLKK